MMTSKKRTGDDPINTLTGGGGGQGSGNTPEAPGVTLPASLTRNSGKYSSDYIAGWRAHAYELVETGALTSNRLGLEVLYLLPDQFVTAYQELFHRALTGGEGQSVMGGKKGGGLEKAMGATGMVTGSETKLQAMPGGKSYKNTPMFVAGDGSELKVKEAVDKELLRVMRDVMGLERRRGLESRTGAPAGEQNLPRLCSGSKLVAVGSLDGVPLLERKGCRRFLKGEWDFCPSCGTRVDKNKTMAD